MDPRDGLPKYVGRTFDFKQRMRSHAYDARRGVEKNKRCFWIRHLLNIGQPPKMKIVYSALMTNKEANSFEKMLIRKVGNHYVLKNSPDNCSGAIKTGVPVYKYDITGKYICSYSNANHARIETSIQDANILRSCKNFLFGCKAGGYRWSFAKVKELPSSKKRLGRRRAICQYSLKGELIKCFESAGEAGRVLKVKYKVISACCNGSKNTAYGYKWKFKSERMDDW